MASLNEVLQEPSDGFFVFTKKGRPPRFWHATVESAQAEAERLATLNPGAKFIVLAGVSKHSILPASGAGSDGATGEASAPVAQVSEAA